MAILKEGEAGVAVAELCRKHEVSAATYYVFQIEVSTGRGSLRKEFRSEGRTR